MNRAEIAGTLKQIAGLMRLRGDEPFRVRAIENAARAVERAAEDPAEMLASGRLMELPGVGKTVASIVSELCQTGRSSIRDALAAEVPPGLPALLRISGLGTTRIHQLYDELGIDSVEALETAISDGRLAQVKGFGPRTIERVSEGIRFLRSVEGKSHFPFALEDALALRTRISKLPDVHRVEIAGELRRALETIGRIDLLVAASDPGETLVHAARLGVFPDVPEISGDQALFCFSSGVEGRVRAVTPERFPSVWMWESASPDHRDGLVRIAVDRGYDLDSQGLRREGEDVAAPSEEAVYETLGLSPVAPELREGLGEIERAAAGPLPALVRETDLTGAFHCHTEWSDGKATLEEMAAAAADRGWDWLGIADHSRAASYANGLSVDRVQDQQRAIDRLHAEAGGGARLLKGIESDILAHGELDYDDDLLAGFDYVVGSIHSGFRMDRETMTDRLVRAVRNPYLTILGHPTGRLLLRRDPYSVDLRRVLAEAIEAGVVLEINANPWRLELDWREVRWAAEQGGRFAINPDAHSPGELAYVGFGVNVARKGGLEPDQVINTWSVEGIDRFLAERRERAASAKRG